MFFVKEGTDICIEFDEERTAYNCGITEIGSFNFQGIQSLSTKEFNKVAKAFEQCLLTKEGEDFPKGYSLQDLEGTRQNRWGDTFEPNKQWLESCGIIIFSDTVRKERNAVSLGRAMPNVLQGKPVENPNSGNTIQLFELTRGY